MNTTDKQAEATIVKTFIRTLNEAFEKDPAAMHAIVCNRVPCNTSLAEHPTIQVETTDVLNGKMFHVGALGILNGILERLTGERVVAVWEEGEGNETCKFIGFDQYKAD